jgi:cytochrome oxidase assembly protein ShyY1
MGRFLLRPRWLAGLALVVVVVISFVRLGFWQLHRLDERRAYEDLVAERLAAAPTPLGDVLTSGSAEEERYRRVEARGTFDPGHEVILYGRTQDDQSGNHVVTPLILADGTAVAVDRGWVPLSDASPPLPDAAPPTGVVRVSGVLFPTEADDAGAGSQRTFSRMNLPALAAQVPYPLAPAYLLLGSQDPPQAGLPMIAPLPDPAESPPHLSYAIQWFTFSAIAVVGFVILVRREYRRSGAVEQQPAGV